MKKAYEKPMIVFENFSLSTNIAAGCENPTNLPSQNQCGIAMEGVGVVFTTGMSGCSWGVEEGKDFDGICYHAPETNNNLFNS